MVVADIALGLLDGHAGALVVGRGHREGEVGGRAVRRDVLHDHVDVDAGVGQRPEDRGGDTGLVLHATDRDLRFVLRKGDAGDNLLFHDFTLVADKRSGRRLAWVDVFGLDEARAHEDAHIMHHAELDRAHLHDLGAERGQLQHFLKGNFVHAVRGFHHARIGGVDAVDVGVDVAALGADRGGNRHGRGIRTAAAERGDTAGFLMDALEAGDDRNLLQFVEALDQFGAIDVHDAGGGVRIVSEDRQLPALPGPSVDTHVFQHQRQQTGGDLFAGRDNGVVFARVMQRRGIPAPRDQLIGDAGHRRDHDGYIVAGVDLALDVPRDVADAVEIGDRRSAEFHYQTSHNLNEPDVPGRAKRR